MAVRKGTTRGPSGQIEGEVAGRGGRGGFPGELVFLAKWGEKNELLKGEKRKAKE